MDPTKIAIRVILAFTATLVACTGQLPNSFRYQQQVENFQTNVSVNTKIDMLWVVDNSPSTAPSQKKVRDGMRQFADKYMKPNWDIRVAVISQDTYLAHPSFASFLNGVAVTGSAARYSAGAGYQSSYLNPSSGASPKRTTAFVNPASWGASLISASGTVQSPGIKLRQGIPEYGGANSLLDIGPTNPSLLSRLLPGHHDGPLATMCWTSSSNAFFYGVSQCAVRDQQNIYNGPANCVAGGSGALDSSVQCVNTLMNNTVRSGKPIISTKPPVGTPADSAWTNQLVSDFIVNLSGGLSGYPMEMEFDSISQLLKDNESSASTSKFFRPGALRVIVITTDEDDQSVVFPTTQTTPDDLYNSGTACASETVDGHTYRVQICPKPEIVRPVADFKNELDTFFRTLDGNPTGNPNYFVTTITPMTGAGIQALQNSMGENADGYMNVSTNYPTRLLQLVDLVGNGSLKMELTNADYSPMLDSIGQAVLTKKNRFTLRFEPTSKDDIVVSVKHSDGTLVRIADADFMIDGFDIVVTNDDIVLALSDTDNIVIDYQPSSIGQN